MPPAARASSSTGSSGMSKIQQKLSEFARWCQRRNPCMIINNSASTIYLTAKSHSHGDPKMPGHIRGKRREIPPQGSIPVNRSDFDLNKTNPHLQIVIYLSCSPNDSPSAEESLILYPHELQDGVLFYLNLEGRRVVRTDGGQQRQADRGLPIEGTVINVDGGQRDGANTV